MATDDERDRALLVAHVAGDRDAFGTLVRLHRDRLYAVALRTLGPTGPAAREEAADALQDALLSAYRAAPAYRGDARVTTWLYRIVVNACLDRVRRRAARPTVPLPIEGAGEPVQPGDPLGDRETALDLEALLAALPVEQRAALVLVDLLGLSVAEAARVLDVPTGTVTSRCSRGRARLAVALGAVAPGAVAPAAVAPAAVAPAAVEPGGVGNSTPGATVPPVGGPASGRAEVDR